MSENAAEPLVSIALCTYNGACHLSEQLDSLLAQTYARIEVVAVDDASTDRTVAILDDYARRDPRVRVAVNASNLGFKRNFERALAICTGDHVALCDQDDIWLPDKIRRLSDAIGTSAMAYCDSELIDAQGASLGLCMSDRWAMQDFTDAVPFVLSNCISGHAMMFRRELLQKALPTPEGFFHDWWLAAVAAATGGIVYLPEILVRYRQHAGNVTDPLGVRKKTALVRKPGFGAMALAETGGRIAAVARLPGSHQALLKKWDLLWNARNEQWFSLGLCFFMARHGKRLFALKRRSAFWRLQRSSSYFLGLRYKRLVNKQKYVLP